MKTNKVIKSRAQRTVDLWEVKKRQEKKLKQIQTTERCLILITL